MEIFDEIEKRINSIEAVEDAPQAETWEAKRLGKFTSSRLGELMTSGRAKDKYWGDTAMNYIYEKLAELLTGVPHYTAETAAMAWGNEHEAEAIEAYSKKKGVEAHRMGTVFVKFNELCGGSPDAYVGDDGVLETKCPYNSAIHIKTYITKEVPQKHLFQCHGNMLFSNRQWCDYVSYDPRMPEDMQLAIIRVDRDEDVCSSILERIEKAAEEIEKIKQQYNLKF